MATYSGREYKVAVGLHGSNFGVATVAGTMYHMRLDTVNDIDFSGADNSTQISRLGQRVLRPTDYVTAHSATNTGGGTYTWGWDNYIPENEPLLQALLTSLLEEADTTGSEKIIGNAATNAYEQGADPAFDLALQIINPDSAKGRYMYSAICDSMTFSMDAGTNGGKLTTSGTMFGGFRPIQYDNSGITINATAATASPYGGIQNIFEMDAVTIGSSAVIAKAFSVTITNPVSRSGHGKLTEASPGSGDIFGQPTSYTRAQPITVEGSITVKYDDNSRGLLDNWLNGTSTAIVFGDHATIGSANCFFGIPTAKFTGYNKDYAGEDGVFIELPFIGTAEATGSLIDLRIT